MRTREVAQHLDFELLLVDQGADEIADADDADDDAVVLDGEVADAVRRHQLHRAAHTILELAGDDILVHHLADRQVRHGLAELLEAMDEVALAEDADMPAPAVGDEEGADIVLGQLAHRLHHRIRGADLVNDALVVLQDIGNAHDTPPRNRGDPAGTMSYRDIAATLREGEKSGTRRQHSPTPTLPSKWGGGI